MRVPCLFLGYFIDWIYPCTSQAMVNCWIEGWCWAYWRLIPPPQTQKKRYLSHPSGPKKKQIRSLPHPATWKKFHRFRHQAEQLRLEQLQLLRQAAQARRQEAQERRQRLGAEALRKQLAAVEAQHAAEQAIKDAQLAQHKAKAEEVVNFGEKKLIGGSWELGGGRWMDFWKVFFCLNICCFCVILLVSLVCFWMQLARIISTQRTKNNYTTPATGGRNGRMPGALWHGLRGVDWDAATLSEPSGTMRDVGESGPGDFFLGLVRAKIFPCKIIFFWLSWSRA